MVTVDLLDPTPSKPDEAVKLLQNDILPLYAQYWQDNNLNKYNKPFEPHIQLLIELWFNGGLRLFIARDNGKAVGFAVCIIFRPLQYQANVLQIHDIYDSHRGDVARMLTDYIENTARILNSTEIWFEQNANLPALSSRWAEQEVFVIKRFVRQE